MALATPSQPRGWPEWESNRGTMNKESVLPVHLITGVQVVNIFWAFNYYHNWWSMKIAVMMQVFNEFFHSFLWSSSFLILFFSNFFVLYKHYIISLNASPSNSSILLHCLVLCLISFMPNAIFLAFGSTSPGFSSCAGSLPFRKLNRMTAIRNMG